MHESTTHLSTRSLVSVLLFLIGLFTATSLLANWYANQRLVRASEYAEAGDRAGKAGDLAKAIELYRNATEISPKSDYRLKLAEALIRSGQPEGASAYLTDLLQTDIGSGEPNLLLARIAAKEGRVDAAITYYQRAIYGFWPHDAQKNRIAARWELIGLLEAAHMQKQVTAQLLELSEQAPTDVPLLMTIGRKLLTHGSSSSAAEIFHEVLRLEPRNGAAQEGLAEADLALSQYADAQTAFRRAIRDGVSTDQVRRLYDLANEVLALDPVRHDLSLLERYRRSLLLVERSAALATICTSSPEPGAKANPLLERAKQVRAMRVPARNLQAATDSNIMLAEQLYALGRNCRESDPVLGRVLARINAK